MTDIAASERRLSAALDRIDGLLERGGWRGAGQPAQPPAADTGAEDAIAALRAENARLTEALEELQARLAAMPAGDMAHADAAEGGDAARLAAANEALAEANRDLIDAQDGQGDEQEAALAALRAEIESLRAARAAEIGQLGEIVIELERLLAGNGISPSAERTGAAAAASEGLRFDAVYGEADDDDGDDDSDQRGGRI